MCAEFIASLLGYNNLNVLKKNAGTSDVLFSPIMTYRNKNISLQGFHIFSTSSLSSVRCVLATPCALCNNVTLLA